ncbi:hypothetical protein [Endozoicomonas ascidiicola]|nr:hypothetical protein [Endozoicomonas ascidiicola]
MVFIKASFATVFYIRFTGEVLVQATHKPANVVLNDAGILL